MHPEGKAGRMYLPLTFPRLTLPIESQSCCDCWSEERATSLSAAREQRTDQVYRQREYDRG